MRQFDALSTSAIYSSIAKKILSFLISVLFVTVLYAQTTISSFTPSSGSIGTLVTITGTNLGSPTALTIGGVSAIAISNTGTSLVAMVMPGAATGTVVVTTVGGTATSGNNFTIIASQPFSGQQGSKLVGTDAIGSSQLGRCVSISADGNTAIIGGSDNNKPAAWVFTRSGGVWSQQGSKLVCTDANGTQRAFSVSISADGNTAMVGGSGIGGSGIGGYSDAWVFTRSSGGVWSQQGSKLEGTGAIEFVPTIEKGTSVSLSADGNTAMVGGWGDNFQTGAAWVFTRSGGVWSQQGSKLVGTGAIGFAVQGISVSLSADGNTAMVGGYRDNSQAGAAWVYTRSGGVWSQQGTKLVGTGATGAALQGISVILSADGNTAIVGGYNDNSSVGAAWLYTRSGGVWSQQGSKLVGTGASGAGRQGSSVSISADGNTAMVGGWSDNSNAGASWVYAYLPPPPPTITNFTTTRGPVGTLVTITGTNLGSPTALTIGGVSAIAISNTGTSLVAMVMPGAATGIVVICTAGGTATSGSNFTVTTSQPPNGQQGTKLVGTGATGAARQFRSVSLSADGNTAVVGGPSDNINIGAAWVYTRSSGVWSQEGTKLLGTGASGAAQQGISVSISADGNTAIVGGYTDNSNTGAVWMFTRSGGVWSQQGTKLVGTGASGAGQQGYSVSLSADGNTAMVGGYADNSQAGAVWIFTRSGGVWSQEGSKLVGTGASGAGQQGYSVSLSADGNTAMVGGYADNSQAGAAWVYTRSGGVWSQQGTKLVGTGATGAAQQGISVSLSADGNTAIVGGYTDNSSVGAAWLYTRSGGVWSQQGPKLVGTGAMGLAVQGYCVSLSADGNTAMVGGGQDNNLVGAAWIFTRIAGVWSQQGSKLVGSGATGAAWQGSSVSLSADGNTAMVGGYQDNSAAGAAWVYIPKNTWTGTTNTDWATASNWTYGTVPINTDAVTIQSVSNQPIIGNSTTAALKEITINSSATLMVNGILQIGGTINNSGTLSATSGTITMNGSSAQTIPASAFSSNTIQNLTINNGSGVILAGVLKVTGIVAITSGTFTSEGNLTIAPGGAITGTYANITGSVRLQQDVIAQRGYRIFANPFSTTQTNLSSAGQFSNITTASDVKTWSQATDSWASAGNGFGTVNIASNQPYSLFVRGAASDNIAGTTYISGPTAFTYSTSGILNGASTAITPVNTSSVLLVGNPYAAPVNTRALTGQTAAPYFTYQISVVGNGQTKQGAWVAAGANSNTSNTIPVLGVIAYQPASTSTFNIGTSDINTGGTLQTGIFGVDTPPVQLELLVEQNGYYQDKLFVRLDAKAAATGTDKMELKKLYNDVTNVYTITADNHRMAIDARNSLTTIPLGITAPTGDYQFKVASNNLPTGTVIYLKDKFLQTQTEFKVGEIYNFSITADTATKGENRFELLTNAAKGIISSSALTNELFTAEVLGNVTSSNSVTVKISGNKGPVSIQAIDLSGKKLSTKQVGAGMQRVQLGNINSGMFLLQFSDGKSTITKKLFKL